MDIIIRDDCVHIEGYVNAVERNSKPLWSRLGRFVERICKGAFTRALDRADDVRILLNHDRGRDLGGIKDGNLELYEDSIGLRAVADIRDADVIQKARQGDLVGWSFGFYDRPGDIENGVDEDTQLPIRKLRDLDLSEVSILDRTKTPAYDGTLVAVRDDTAQYFGEAMLQEAKIIEENMPKEAEERSEPQEEADDIDYSRWEQMIKEMRED